MMFRYRSGILIALGLFAAASAGAQNRVALSHLGTYSSGIFNQGGAEIVAYDPDSERLFVVNAQAATINILDIRKPNNPTLVRTIDVTPYGAVANSVAVHDGVVAVAIENANRQASGRVVFYNTSGRYLNDLEVGALPDMLTFSPNGKYVMVANEGEPSADYSVDPEGTVSIIDMKGRVERLEQCDVRTVSFRAFNNRRLDPSIRVYGPNATVAQDFEPEYITISDNSKTAWVTLQENNAIAEIDIKDGKVTALRGLGFKNHGLAGNGLDASDRDNAINITNWPVYGMYLPDGIASYKVGGDTYLVTANEGDAREYSAFVEEVRVKDITLDPTVFPNRATLRTDPNIGRLTVTRTKGDVDGDGDFDALYALGGRSFSIWNSSGALVFDSNDDLEQITAAAYPAYFNNDPTGAFDTRSDNKGPEPEGVVVGKAYGRHYAFIGLERIGGIVVYDVSNPSSPVFVQYINHRIFTGNPAAGTAGDLAPEGLKFIDADDSPNGKPLLAVANEVSGTTSIFQIDRLGHKPVVEESNAAGMSLMQNYPNPFAGSTTIPFVLSREAHVGITLIDLSGRTVATLADGEYAAGSHSVELAPANLPAGSYFYRLDVDGSVVEMRQLVYGK